MTAAEQAAHDAWASEERDDAPADTDWEVFAGNPRETGRWYRAKYIMVTDEGDIVRYSVLDGEPDGERDRANGWITRRATDDVQVAIDHARHAARIAADDVIDADEYRRERALARCGQGRAAQGFELGGEG